ncbi:hypothetical protein D3C81_469020 [compost metagenome]
MLLRQPLEPCRQRRIDIDLQARTAKTLAQRPRMIGGQFEHQRLTPEFADPVAELPLTLPGVHPFTLPQGIVSVVDRQLGQLHRHPTNLPGIHLHQFADQHLHRPAIGNDVMQGQRQHMLIFCHLQYRRAQQWLQFQIKGLAQLRRKEGLDGSLGRHAFAERLDRQLEITWLTNHLQGLLALLDEAGAQGCMTGDQHLESGLQGRQVQGPAQAQGSRDVVRRALRLQLPEKPLALLGVGQQQRCASLPLEDRCNSKEIDTFLFEHDGQGLALFCRQCPNRTDQFLHVKNSFRKSAFQALRLINV